MPYKAIRTYEIRRGKRLERAQRAMKERQRATFAGKQVAATLAYRAVANAREWPEERSARLSRAAKVLWANHIPRCESCIRNHWRCTHKPTTLANASGLPDKAQ